MINERALLSSGFVLDNFSLESCIFGDILHYHMVMTPRKIGQNTLSELWVL